MRGILTYFYGMGVLILSMFMALSMDNPHWRTNFMIGVFFLFLGALLNLREPRGKKEEEI